MTQQVTYREILSHKWCRTISFGAFVSWGSDWLTTISLFLYAAQATDSSPLAISLVLGVRSLSFTFLSPWGGAFADSMSRKWLMVVTNLLAALTIVIFVVFDLMSHGLASVYLLAFLIVVFRAIYDPSQTAYISNVCESDQSIVTSNALVSMIWSSSLGLGAAFGGYIVSRTSLETALLIDAGSYIFAALLFTTLQPGGPDSPRDKAFKPIGTIVQGWRYVIARPELARWLYGKSAWSLAGGAVLVLLVLMAFEADIGAVGGGAIGLLFFARGIGSGAGPFLGRSLIADDRLTPVLVGFCLMGCGSFYLVVAHSPWTSAVLLLSLVMCAHAISGLSWVKCTSQSMIRSDDAFRGRVSATDEILFTFTMGISAIGAGLILEYGLLSLRETIMLAASIHIIGGLAWWIFIAPKERAYLAS